MKKEIIIFFWIAIVALILVVIYQQNTNQEKITVEISRDTFQLGELNIINEEMVSPLQATIHNSYKFETICFSACHPYYLVREEPTYEFYRYARCDDNQASFCIKPGEKRTFEVRDAYLSNATGSHHLVVPVCYECVEGGPFFTDKYLHSSNFVIE